MERARHCVEGTEGARVWGIVVAMPERCNGKRQPTATREQSLEGSKCRVNRERPTQSGNRVVVTNGQGNKSTVGITNRQ